MRSIRAARILLAVFLFSALFVMTRIATAQSVYGQISGRLTTGAGTPVSGALVTATAALTQARSEIKSDAGGYFNFVNLAPDVYQIEVLADGFKRVEGKAQVSADDTASVNATLLVSSSGVVPKTLGSGPLKLDRSDVSVLFDSQPVEELPLFNQNLTRLELLAPGAVQGHLLISDNQNPQGGRPVDINGQHFSGSAFQVDGTEDRDPLEGIVVINPTLDSVEEMKVTTQGFNAEFGNATGGVITVQTRTGGNTWHGDAFDFRRTGFGQSEDPFSPAGVPPGKHNIFGGSIGGPIAKDKLFVFGDYQGTRSSQGANVLLSVPPKSVHDTCTGSKGAAGSVCDLSPYAPFISGTLINPKTNLPFVCSPMACPPYSIPNSAVSDQAVAILKLVPLPTNNNPTDQNCAPNGTSEAVCNNFLASGQEPFNADQFDARADFNANSRFRLFGRYSFGNFYDSGPPAFGATAGGLGVDPMGDGFAGVARTRNQGISSGFTYTLNPKLLTDFRFGYFRYRLAVNPPDGAQTPDLGIPGIFASDTNNPFATGMPDFQIPEQLNKVTNRDLTSAAGDYLRLGYSVAVNSCNCPLREREQQFQVANNWTRTTGRHIFRWGADLRFLQNYRLESNRPQTGYFNFSPNPTGLGLATFLIGDVTAFERTVSTPAAANADEHQKRFGFYGQDTWRISPRLTVNYGLRWEIYFPQTVTGAGGFLIPNLSDNKLEDARFSVGATGGVLQNLTNFAPRLGFAYLIRSDSVIRAGYARSFDAGYAGDIFGIAATQNPPISADQKIASVGFYLQDGPPAFNFPPGRNFSLKDIAAANIRNVDKGLPSSGDVVYALPSRVRVPTVDSWNLTFQHELSPSLYFEIAYVGNKGTNVFTDSNTGATYYNLNQPDLGKLIQAVPINSSGKADTSQCQGTNAIFYPPNGPPNGNTLPSYCLILPQYRTFYQREQVFCHKAPTNTCYIDPTLFEVRYFGNNASDNYNSLQAKINKRFSRGYSFLAHYTWSKGLDYDSSYFRVDPRIGYGPDNFDIRHRFVMTNILDLPIGRGKAFLGGIGPVADRFAGGWRLSAITIWRSGFPFTPSYNGTNCSHDTDSGAPCRPNRVGPVQILGSRQEYFSTTATLPGNDCTTSSATAFCGVDPNTGQPVHGDSIGPWQRPGAGQIGNAGRNSLTGPGFFQSDISLAKVIPVSEGVYVRFRADAFNAFNRVNLANPNPCVDCAKGGLINSLAVAAIQRTLQFSVRIEF